MLMTNIYNSVILFVSNFKNDFTTCTNIFINYNRFERFFIASYNENI